MADPEHNDPEGMETDSDQSDVEEMPEKEQPQNTEQRLRRRLTQLEKGKAKLEEEKKYLLRGQYKGNDFVFTQAQLDQLLADQAALALRKISYDASQLQQYQRSQNAFIKTSQERLQTIMQLQAENEVLRAQRDAARQQNELLVEEMQQVRDRWYTAFDDGKASAKGYIASLEEDAQNDRRTIARLRRQLARRDGASTSKGMPSDSDSDSEGE